MCEFKVFTKHIITFCISLVVAIGLLILCTYLPQEPIDENVLSSAYQLMDEEVSVADHSYASMMSTTSEALMFMESKAMNKNDPMSVLTNPRYIYGESLDASENLLRYASGETHQYIDPYSRYWMGFRVTLRLLLQKLDFLQIKRYTATIFFVLCFGAICSIAQNVNSSVAFLFASSIILVRPHIIAISLQSFSCFAIALIAILTVPLVWQHPKWESILFMEIGITTMYFDFYTFPPLTLGLPLIYLYMIHWKNNTCYSSKKILQNSISWFLGYTCMWLSKLLITTLFTDENSIAGGFRQFLYWIQSYHPSDNFDMDCGPISALYHVALTLIYDNEGKLVLSCCLVFILLIFVVRYIIAKPKSILFLRHSGLIIIGMIPIIWFCIASKPTVIHHYFQYRSIAVSFCSVLCYLYICTSRNNTQLLEST